MKIKILPLIALLFLGLTPAKGQDNRILTFEEAKASADNGDAYGEAVVAFHYSVGWQTEKNPELAAKFALSSTQKGHPLGAFRLGAIFRSGDGVPKNENQGLELQKRAFQGLNNMSGNPYAITALGVMLFQGKVVPENKKEAARLYKIAADMGFAPAQFNFAMCSDSGYGIRKDHKLRDVYLKQAAAQEYPLAVETLVKLSPVPAPKHPILATLEQPVNWGFDDRDLLSEEQYVPSLSPSDPEWQYIVLTVRDLKKAAEAGDAYAQAALSIHYSVGWKVSQDHQLAYKYAKLSADQGNGLGLYRLGSALRKGEGIEKDEEAGKRAQAQAVKGLKAMKGSPYADTAIGVLLYEGTVLPQNKVEAWRLYIYAAQKGFPPAAANLIYWPRNSELAPVSDTRSRLHNTASQLKGFSLNMPYFDHYTVQADYEELLAWLPDEGSKSLKSEQMRWSDEMARFARQGGSQQVQSKAKESRKADIKLRLYKNLGGVDEVPKILQLSTAHFKKAEILEGLYALDRAKNIDYKAPNFDSRPSVIHGRDFAQTYLANGEAQLDVYDDTIEQQNAGFAPNAGHAFGNAVDALMSYHKLYPRNGVEDGELLLKDPLAADAYDGLARFNIKEGRYLEALAKARRALEIRKEVFGDKHYLTKRALRILGDVYIKLGSFERARALYSDADHSDMTQDKGQRLEASNLMASRADLALREKKNEDALQLIQSSLAIRKEQLGEQHPNTIGALITLGDIYMALGCYEDARTCFSSAHEHLSRRSGSFNKSAIACTQRLAGVNMAESRYGNAEDGYRLVERSYKRMLGARHPLTTDATRQLAAALILSGKNDEARTVVEKWVNGIHSELKDMLTTGESQRIDWSAKNLTFGLPAVTLPPLEMANLILRWKGVVLDSLMEDMTMKGANGSQLAKIRDLKTELTKLLSGSGKFDAKKAEVLQKQIDELEQASVSKEIVRSSEWATFEEIQAALPDNGALIDLVRYSDIRNGGSAYGALIVGSNEPVKYFAIEDADAIDEAVRAYRKSVASGDEDKLEGALAVLQEKLWLPLREQIPSGAERLYIGPDGVLNFMSFATLLDRDGKFAAEAFQIAYVGSGRDLLRANRSPPNKNITVFADPIFQLNHASGKENGGDKGSDQLVADLRSAEIAEFSKLQLAPLPGTKIEAESVKAVASSAQWNTDVYEGERASKKQVTQVNAPAVLHLATHGFFLGAESEEAASPDASSKQTGGMLASVRSIFGSSPGNAQAERGMQVVAAASGAESSSSFIRAMNPMRQSGLALAGGQSTLEAWAKGRFPDTRNDGILTAEEVAALDLDGTWLVTLSACETGVGKVVSGEGVFGLRRAFMMAGVQNLLMTLWPVSDATTPKIMQDFYALGLASLDAVDALSKVQKQWLLKLRSVNGLLAAVRDAGPFALVAMSEPPTGQAGALGSKRDLADCIEITKVLMAQTGDGTNDDLLNACTKRFRKLLEKGYAPLPGEEIPYFNYDFRYETQDSYPRIVKMGPAVLEGEAVKVPVELRFDAYNSSEGESFRKMWIFVRENGNWKADDLLTERASEPVKSLSKELTEEFSK